MFLTLLCARFTWWGYLLAFLLFRLADIVKPFPANWADRHVHGGFGVMLDDLIAGLYARIATWLLSGYFTNAAERFGSESKIGSPSMPHPGREAGPRRNLT